LVVCCRSRRAPLGLEKRRCSLSQKDIDACVAGDLAIREQSPRASVGESAMSERAASAGSWRQSQEIGHGKRRSIEGATSSSMEGSSGRESRVIFTDTREKRPRRSRHGRQAQFAQVGTTRSDRRVRGSVRGIVVTPSSNRHGPKKPTTSDNPEDTPKRIGRRETPDCSSERARASVATRVENPRDAGARSR
jgi:hypothetical protein